MPQAMLFLCETKGSDKSLASGISLTRLIKSNITSDQTHPCLSTLKLQVEKKVSYTFVLARICTQQNIYLANGKAQTVCSYLKSYCLIWSIRIIDLKRERRKIKYSRRSVALNILQNAAEAIVML